MIAAGFLGSVEFYVIAVLVAAAVLGLCVRPAVKGAVRTFLYPGFPEEEGRDEESVELTCRDDGAVVIERHGVKATPYSRGSLSLAVNVAGFDVVIKERFSPSTPKEGEAAPAGKFVFVTDFAGREYYHVRYINEDTGQLAVFTLHNRPGIHILKPLAH